MSKFSINEGKNDTGNPIASLVILRERGKNYLLINVRKELCHSVGNITSVFKAYALPRSVDGGAGAGFNWTTPIPNAEKQVKVTGNWLKAIDALSGAKPTDIGRASQAAFHKIKTSPCFHPFFAQKRPKSSPPRLANAENNPLNLRTFCGK